ncbi:hypothetical protein BX661DRAFT_191898 [Kickxella alabastrina]|uniref:uncharacterized protein n=1 Tax=Kickxella alabastrina TaxID=61397 RepID=UPI00221E9A79|nr:uncharacterized protein BX661DRAFT_191898 [Kickxella alabastrina]KAI7818194.1 hypothetical protein BX661DRAFT_191898 [Kickxella alabastrina]
MYCFQFRSASSSRSCYLILREILPLGQPFSSPIHRIISVDCGRIGIYWLQLCYTLSIIGAVSAGVVVATETAVTAAATELAVVFVVAVMKLDAAAAIAT